MMEPLDRSDNACFIWLLNLFKNPWDEDQNPQTKMDFDILMMKVRPFLQSQGSMIWYRSMTFMFRIQTCRRVHSPTEDIQIYSLLQNLTLGYKL